MTTPVPIRAIGELPSADPTPVPATTAPPTTADVGGARTETTGAAPLRQTAIRSGAYLAVREAVGAAVRLAGLVVVTRRIGPSDYGIYTAAAVYSSLAVLVAQMGCEVFLVRQPGPLESRRYDEAFTFLLATSTLMAAVGIGLTFLLAPWIRPTGALDPTRVLLASTPINVLWAPAQAAIERRFAYRAMGLLELGGDVVLYATAVPLAMRGGGAWALVAGYVAWQTWLLVGAIVLAGLRPRLRWSRATSAALLRHGTSYSLTSWLLSARSSLATLVVASFTGASGVGYMGFATKLVATLNFTERGMHRVGMVAISRARDARSTHLSQAVEEGVLLQTIAAALPFVAFSLAARWVIPDLFGREWLSAVPVYVLLAMAAVLRMPESVQRVVLFAHGRNIDVAISRAIELVLVVGVSLVAVQRFGVVGFGIASLVGVGATLYTQRATRRYVALRYRRIVLPVLAVVPPVFIPAVPMPWTGLLLVPTVLLFATPSLRREVVSLVRTVRSVLPARRRDGRTPQGSAAVGAWHRAERADVATGLSSAAALIARTTRLLGARRPSGWSLLVAAFDVGTSPRAREGRAEGELLAAAGALRAELRFDDRAARVGPTTLVVAVPFLHDLVDAEQLARRLETAVTRALHERQGAPAPAVGAVPAARMAHHSTELRTGVSADRLVRMVVDRVRT